MTRLLDDRPDSIIGEAAIAQHVPGTGWFECDQTGLVVERFTDGSCSFDLFDAREWPGGDQEGMAYARLIGATEIEAERLREALRTYAAIQRLDLKTPGQLQRDLRAIAGAEHVHVASIGSDRCLLCGLDLRHEVHKRSGP